MRIPKEIQQGAWVSRIKDHFNVRLAIIEVRPGETREDSWKRHITEHPEAKDANIKVFHRMKYDQDLLNSRNGQIG